MILRGNITVLAFSIYTLLKSSFRKSFCISSKYTSAARVTYYLMFGAFQLANYFNVEYYLSEATSFLMVIF